jgi:flavin-dependent dehydrogenase
MIAPALPRKFDLVICGGGLAGLGLARQLRLSGNPLSILIIDPIARPLPHAGFKIGESTVEIGAFYYDHTLQLYDYLEESHLEKLGLRYFFQSTGDFASRPEYGARRFLPAKSYQVDRGTLETKLRELVVEAGVDLVEGARVRDIQIDGQGPHHVQWTDADGIEHTTEAGWVVDAMGRRRYLQSRLGHMKKSPRPRNSVWWRVKGKVSVNEWVPASNTAWHERAIDDRWQSTCHLMGEGYWVWIIPLAPDNTSIGIVTLDALHPYDTYGGTPEKAMAWLRQHEPTLASAMEQHEVIDFGRLKSYSHSSTRVISADRWACTGVSGVFADPYYSVGTNLIAYSNGFIQRMIEMDQTGKPIAEFAEYANRYVLTLNDAITENISRGYPNMGFAPVAALKTIWDYYIGWGTSDPQYYHELYLDPVLAKTVSGLVSRVVVTQARMLALFEEWGRRSSRDRVTFDYLDYIDDLPTLKAMHLRTLPDRAPTTVREQLAHMRDACDRIEEVAHIIFRMAVRDVLPEEYERVASAWINIEALSLDADSWNAQGLFRPRTQPRDMTAHEAEISRLFRWREGSSLVQSAEYAAPAVYG